MTTPPRTPLVLLTVSAGGVLGALSRYGLGEAFPHVPGQWPWAVLLINVSGGLAIGALMAWLDAAPAPSPLVRPFLATGVLGGFTTLSAASLDGYQLIDGGRPGAAAAYLVITAGGALLATVVGGLLMAAWCSRGPGDAPGDAA